MSGLSATADARSVVAALGLEPHPEGGWYRETWRAPPAGPEVRSAATAILYLLEAGGCSHWHRVDAAELWLFHAGSPLALSIADSLGGVRTTTLGADPLAGQDPQMLVPAGAWQSAQASQDGWTLVACVVVPGFEFAGFELAPEGWTPDAL
jgi:predicted cupin superfamily sugar epimerase